VQASLSRRDPTLLGSVRNVLGAQITVELLPGIAGTTPLYRGRVYYLGQIGSLVRVPHGSIDLLGAVTMVGISELAGPRPPGSLPEQGERWIQFQLLGQLDGTGHFERGVSAYPALDDPVHFATAQTLQAIYPPATGSWVNIGTISSTASEAVAVDLQRLVIRHSALVGATGSGKSSTVARILQRIVASGFGRANVVVIDPHGEYGSALKGIAAIESVLGENANLSIPYWALSLADTLRVLGRGAESAGVRLRLQELMVAARRRFAEEAGWTQIAAEDITVDSPVPYDIRQVWYEMDYENRATYPQTGGQGQACVVDAGNPLTFLPAQFQPYGPGGAAPFKGKQYDFWGTFPDRMRARLLDPRFGFLRRSWPNPAEPDPLIGCLDQWLGKDRPVSVLDLSGVASEAADVAVGVILSLLFEVAISSPPDSGIGRARPLLVVLEEAHRYLGKGAPAAASLAGEAADRIAREGRKYGVGLMAVTQRPTELSDVILSQVGTIISLRLTNSSDQATVKSALPDAVANIAEALPALRTGEALVTGEAIPLPTRILIERPDPPPAAADPTIDTWKGPAAQVDVNEAVALWRSRARAG
jgi:uncharacterized protein